MHPTPAAPVSCASCAAALAGPYCHACGEKLVDPEHDFSVRHFLEEAVEGFTHFDSRVARTFTALFAQPGHLTAELIAGRRVGYLKPIPMFLLAGVRCAAAPNGDKDSFSLRGRREACGGRDDAPTPPVRHQLPKACGVPI